MARVPVTSTERRADPDPRRRRSDRRESTQISAAPRGHPEGAIAEEVEAPGDLEIRPFSAEVEGLQAQPAAVEVEACGPLGLDRIVRQQEPEIGEGGGSPHALRARQGTAEPHLAGGDQADGGWQRRLHRTHEGVEAGVTGPEPEVGFIGRDRAHRAREIQVDPAGQAASVDLDASVPGARQGGVQSPDALVAEEQTRCGELPTEPGTVEPSLEEDLSGEPAGEGHLRDGRREQSAQVHVVHLSPAVVDPLVGQGAGERGDPAAELHQAGSDPCPVVSPAGLDLGFLEGHAEVGSLPDRHPGLPGGGAATAAGGGPATDATGEGHLPLHEAGDVLHWPVDQAHLTLDRVANPVPAELGAALPPRLASALPQDERAGLDGLRPGVEDPDPPRLPPVDLGVSDTAAGKAAFEDRQRRRPPPQTLERRLAGEAGGVGLGVPEGPAHPHEQIVGGHEVRGLSVDSELRGAVDLDLPGDLRAQSGGAEVGALVGLDPVLRGPLEATGERGAFVRDIDEVQVDPAAHETIVSLGPAHVDVTAGGGGDPHRTPAEEHPEGALPVDLLHRSPDVHRAAGPGGRDVQG